MLPTPAGSAAFVYQPPSSPPAVNSQALSVSPSGRAATKPLPSLKEMKPSLGCMEARSERLPAQLPLVSDSSSRGWSCVSQKLSCDGSQAVARSASALSVMGCLMEPPAGDLCAVSAGGVTGSTGWHGSCDLGRQ